MFVRLLNAVFLTIGIGPAFVLGITLLSQTGAVFQEYTLRLTNLVLAHYLNDRVTIQPSKFEHLPELRSALVEAFLNFETSGAVFTALIWEFATAFVGHKAWAILNAHPVVALYRAALCDSGPWRI